MSTDAWFADYTSGAFFGAPGKSPITEPDRVLRDLAKNPTGHGPDWWDGFGTGLADAAGSFGPEDPAAGEWLSDPQSVAGYLFVQLTNSVVTVDAGAVRLDRAVEDCQRLLEHLGVEPTAAASPSNVLPFARRQLRDGAR